MCTTIKAESNEGYLLARTMDFESPLIYNGLYLPRNYNFAQDLEGNKLYTKYESMGIVFYKTIPLKDGINEHGLSGSTNYYHAMNNHSNKIVKDKLNLSSLDYMNYALANYKNIGELIADLDNIHISSVNSQGQDVICPDFHHMFVDRQGACVVVEPKNKEYTFYENPYSVMTNSPSFESHVKKLHKSMDLENLQDFNGAKNLPGGYDPKSRFIRAYYFVHTQLQAEDQVQGISQAYNIMDALSLAKGFIYSNSHNHHIYTRYISVYDTKNNIMTAKSRTNPRVYWASFDDFKSDRPVFFDFETELTMDKFNLGV